MRFHDRFGGLVEKDSRPMRQPKASLTHAQRLVTRDRAMWSLRKMGWTVAEISVAFGMTEQLVRMVIRSLRELERLNLGDRSA